MTEPRPSRRTVLTAAALAAVGPALAGCTVRRDAPRRADPTPTPTTAPTSTPEEATIFDLSFTLESRYRPFELVAPGFVAVRRGAADLREEAGVATSDQGPPAPFCALEAEVSGPSARVELGLRTPDGSTHVVGFFDRAQGRVGIEVRTGGRSRLVRRRKLDLPEEFRLAVAICENQVTVLCDTGEGWRPLLTERDKVRAALDLRRPDVLSPLRYAWAGQAALRSVTAGLFGMTGIRDQHLVQHTDGTPYVRDGKAYFTGTCAGLGFFAQAHWGVFALDLADPSRLEQVSQLYFHRDGLLLGDHAGQVVRDDARDEWLVATSSWGDFDFDGVHVRHVVTDADVLSGVHVLETVPTTLPTEHSAWDPGITMIDDRWHVSFVESPSQEPFDFHPALAAEAADRATAGASGGTAALGTFDQDLELVGAATDLHQCEGPILAQVQGTWWLLASDGDDRNYPVFDLAMRRVGRLDAPYFTNIPHPQLVPLEDGSHLLVTFDGTQYAERVMGYGGHGDVLIMRTRAAAG